MFKKLKSLFKVNENPFKWVGKTLTYKVNSLWNTMYFNRTKRRALRAWKMTGLQHHIIPAGTDKVMIINNRWLYWYNKQPKVKKINILDLLKMSYYSTPSSERIITKK